MYRNLRPACAVTLLATVCVLVSSLASAETEILRYRAKGDGLHSQFYKVDGCLLTETFIDVLENRVSDGPGRPEATLRLGFSSSDYDLCTESYISSLTAYTEIPVHDFQMRGLKSASLQTTVLAQDWRDGVVVDVPVTLDLLWSGVGKTMDIGTSVERSRLPGFSYTRRSSGAYRYAVLSGNLWWGTRDLLADYEYIYSVLLSNQDAKMTIVFNKGG